MPINDGAVPIPPGTFQDWVRNAIDFPDPYFKHVLISREVLEAILQNPDAAGLILYQTKYTISKGEFNGRLVTTLAYAGVDQHGNPLDGADDAVYYSERPCPPYCDWKPLEQMLLGDGEE